MKIISLCSLRIFPIGYSVLLTDRLNIIWK